MNAQLLIFVAIGVFTFVCAAFDFDWFMNHRKAKLFVNVMGRDGARVFYMVIGAVIAVGGFFICR